MLVSFWGSDVVSLRMESYSEAKRVLDVKGADEEKEKNRLLRESQERPSPKPKTHIVYSPYFGKIYKFPPTEWSVS